MVMQLDELCEFKNGLWKGKKEPFIKVKILRNTNFEKDGNFNFSDVATHDVEIKQLESKVLKYGDILLERSGGGPKQPVGRVALFNVDDGTQYSFGNFTTRIRVKNREMLDEKFLYYFLQHIYIIGVTEKLQKQTHGIRNLDFSEYKKIKIPLPPVTEQRHIVEILEKVGDIRTKRQHADDLSNKIIQSAFVNIFKDLKRYEKKFLYEIIKDQKLGLVKSLAQQNPIYKYNYFKMNNIALDGNCLFNEIVKVNATAEEAKIYSLKKYDFLFNTRNTPELVGKTCVFTDDRNFLFNNNIMRIRFVNNISSYYINTLFHTKDYKDKLNKIKSGTTSVSAIYFKNLKMIKIPIPPARVQQNFSDLVQKVEKIKEKQQESKEELDNLFNAIMHKTFKD